jgi:tryptophan 2,3-dioxygenase
MSYGDYLQLDAMLNAQQAAVARPQRDAVHRAAPDQRAVDEADAARAATPPSRPSPRRAAAAFKMLARVSKIMEQLVHAWDVLATMTPPEYSAIRPTWASSAASRAGSTAASSSLGNKNAAMLKPHAHRPSDCWRWSTGRYRAFAVRRSAAPAGAPRPAGARRATPSATGQPYSPATRWNRPGCRSTATPNAALGPVPARRGTHRPGRRLPPLALPPRDHGGARHRLQARHRRHQRRGYLRKMLDVVLFPEIWKLREAPPARVGPRS